MSLVDVALELKEALTVEDVSQGGDQNPMQIGSEIAAKQQRGGRRQYSRGKRQLRSPGVGSKALPALDGNCNREGRQGKRKISLVDEEMEDVVVEE